MNRAVILSNPVSVLILVSSVTPLDLSMHAACSGDISLSAAATNVAFKRSQGMIRMHILVRRTTGSVLVVVDAVISSTLGIVDLAALRNTIGTKL